MLHFFNNFVVKYRQLFFPLNMKMTNNRWSAILKGANRFVSLVFQPISHCRTLFFFLLLMVYTIKIADNLTGTGTDAFLSTLLPIFDCYLLCLFSYGLKKIRLGFVIPIIATTILFSELFTIFFYHSNFTIYVILLLFETNSKESSEFINAALTQWSTWYAVMLTMGMAVLSILFSKLSRRQFTGRRAIICLGTALILWSGIRQISAYYKLTKCFSSASTTVCNDPHYRPHLNTPFVRLAYGVAYNMASSAELDVLAESVEATQVDSCSYRCPLIVLVIGESYNKHHSQLYGYDLPTTPRLLKKRDEGSLIVYNDAVTPYNFTSNAFKYMFSTWDDEGNDDWTQHTLFPAIFKKAGYEVDFYTNQFAMEQTNVWDYTGGTIFNHAQLSDLQFSSRNSSVFTYDGMLIDQIPSADELAAKPTLLIVHLEGQHVKYDKKYPAEFARFNPEDEKTPYGGELGKQTAAHYDNATYYNDYIVDSVFNMVREKDAIAIYLSDHGEEAYDWRNQYERTNEGTLYPEVAHYQYEIPFMFFMTDSFRVNHPDVAEAVKTSADRRFFSCDLPHLLIYLGGISTPEYKEKRNILSPKYDLNRKRIIRNDVNYDELIEAGL